MGRVLGMSGDLGHVAHIGAAAAAQNLNMRKPTPDVGQLLTQLGRVAVIKRLGFIKFGMATPRGVGDDPLQALGPVSIDQRRGNVIGVGAVDHEVHRVTVCGRVNLGNRVVQAPRPRGSFPAPHQGRLS